MENKILPSNKINIEMHVTKKKKLTTEKLKRKKKKNVSEGKKIIQKERRKTYKFSQSHEIIVHS